jgi:ATP-dependent Clp protease, protease subunit
MAKLLVLEKPKFEIRNKTETSAEIVIYQAIGQDWFGEGLTAKTVKAELDKLPKSIKNLSVRINSPGGDVFDGISIFNLLKSHSAKKTVYVDGLAASIASIIMLAGDEIILGEGSLVMIHKPMTMAFGNSDELEKSIQRLDDVEEQLVSIYARKTKLDRAEIRSMLREETWLDADQAIAKGFADKSVATDMPIAAAFDKTPWIKNKPEQRVSLQVKNHAEELKKEIEDFILARK